MEWGHDDELHGDLFQCFEDDCGYVWLEPDGIQDASEILAVRELDDGTWEIVND
jgi:hypothetical protein